ncbi:hypothetical protein DK37_29115 [Halomonas sp. SUBG004]|nr:hypothetical protein DK37_29115 [Halomonas sp. SUBG004]
MSLEIIIGMTGSIVSIIAVLFITRFLQKGQVESSLTRKEVEYLKEELREAQKYSDSRPKDLINLVNSLKYEVHSMKK